MSRFQFLVITPPFFNIETTGPIHFVAKLLFVICSQALHILSYKVIILIK